ncbi:MAG: M20/M25/M40 family metallo-hydrolase [Actinobacteria bacterium]|nr:MAG: M20/M25/M40 family metallo-hydrolase [Actinomycetota bacterium]
MLEQATLVEAVDAEAAVDWLRRAVATPSVTGDELAFARLVAAELEVCGADEVHVEEVAPGRPIVWSVARGTGGGASLLLSGHLDTVRTDGWRERWQGTEREDPFAAAIVDGAIWGRGSADLKAGIATALGALRTLHAAGVRHAGDVVTAWVCDEESGEPGLGRSIGMHAVAQRIDNGTIPHADFAVYVEPTSLAVYTAQIGFVIADVEIEGRSAYFGRPEEGVDALRAGHRVLTELWELADEIATRDAHPLIGSPKLLVTEAAAGGYIAVPGSCRLSMIRSLVPGEDLSEAVAEIEAAVARGVEGTRTAASVTFPAGRDHAVGGLPAETSAELPAVEALLDAVRAVAPGRERVEGSPYWAEMSFLAARGIPCVYFAPGDIANAHTAEEHVRVDELVDGVKALSLFIAGHCAGTIEGGVT